MSLSFNDPAFASLVVTGCNHIWVAGASESEFTGHGLNPGARKAFSRSLDAIADSGAN
jgi:hypothetical protein